MLIKENTSRHIQDSMACNFVIRGVKCRFEEGENIEPPIGISKDVQPSVCGLLAWGRRMMHKLSDGVDKLGLGMSWESDGHSC